MGSRLFYANRNKRNWCHCRQQCFGTVSGLMTDWQLQEGKDSICLAYLCIVLNRDRCPIQDLMFGAVVAIL